LVYFWSHAFLGEIWDSVLQYDITDSHVNGREETIQFVAFKIKKLTMCVELPRACTKAELRMTFGGQHHMPMICSGSFRNRAGLTSAAAFPQSARTEAERAGQCQPNAT
jgi:hypothetical protein